MKTNKQNKTNKQEDRTSLVSELQNRTEQLVKAPEKAEGTTLSAGGEGQGEVDSKTQTPSVKPYVNFAEREHNRNLPLEKVLEKLRRWMPQQYELAEVVGKWIWITRRGKRAGHQSAARLCLNPQTSRLAPTDPAFHQLIETELLPFFKAIGFPTP
jgi:hypothetical protein